MDNTVKFCTQIALLNELKSKKMVTKDEYEKIRMFIKKKYGIGVYGM